MRIGIPIFDLVSTTHFTGVERYTYNLVSNMTRLNRQDDFFIYHRFYQDPGRFGGFKTRRVIHRLYPKQMRSIAFKMDRIKILHLPVYFENIPYLVRGKNILTIHDLVPLFKPEWSMEGLPDYFSKLKREIGKIDMLIASSEHTKRDAMEHLGVPENKIKVVYEAADERYRPTSCTSEIKDKYGLNSFILFVGTLEPRKNIPNLIRAFGKLNRKDYQLVIAGKKGWKYEEIFKTVEELGLKDRIKFLGYVFEEDLCGLYNTADLFVYPSLYEGFGLPPLEAMACGTPVITSNRSSLPEVVGNAGVMVGPESVDEMAKAMDSVLEQPSVREEMSRRGLEQAKRFSWRKCAQETLDLYQTIL